MFNIFRAKELVTAEQAQAAVTELEHRFQVAEQAVEAARQEHSAASLSHVEADAADRLSSTKALDKARQQLVRKAEERDAIAGALDAARNRHAALQRDEAANALADRWARVEALAKERSEIAKDLASMAEQTASLVRRLQEAGTEIHRIAPTKDDTALAYSGMSPNNVETQLGIELGRHGLHHFEPKGAFLAGELPRLVDVVEGANRQILMLKGES